VKRAIYIATAALLLAVIGSIGAFADPLLSDDFEGSAVGTPSGNVTYVTGAPQGTYAASLGLGSNISYGVDYFTGVGSLSFWLNPVRPSEVGQTKFIALGNKDSNAANGNFLVIMDPNGYGTGNIGVRFLMYDSSNKYKYIDAPIPVNQWSYLTLSAGSEGMKLWVNHTLKNFNTSVTYGFSNKALYIGDNPNDGLSYSYAGKIDWLRASTRQNDLAPEPSAMLALAGGFISCVAFVRRKRS